MRRNRFVEVINARFPAGTHDALERIAESEGRQPADIIRAAVQARIEEARTSQEAA